MVNIDQVDWHDRTHFIAVAAQQMRRILVDSARARRYQKRGGGAVNVTFDEALVVSERSPDLVALDDALETLALEISTDTVTRDWQMAKLWLRRALKKERHAD